jgi:dynein assembly factor 1
MSPAEIRLSCMENDGYETPELNDKLYLHFRGFKKIENLEPYTGCKAIWMDSNGFDKIEGLDSLVELRCLYLAKNLISKICGLSNLQFLTTLDLSANRLTVIENLSCCPALMNLNVSKNAISQLENIQHLTECHALQTIDIMDNQLDGDILPTLERIPALLSISLNGNATTRQANFRKRTIAALPKLCYLDRPVEEQERLAAVAFIAGGPEAEKEARDAWRERQRQQRADEMDSFRVWQRTQRETRDAQLAAGTYVGNIKDFTEEETAARAAEAQEAVDDEKVMLEGGVAKLAKKYWALDGRRDEQGGNFDALNEAVVQMRMESAAGIAAPGEGEGGSQVEDSPGEIVIEHQESPADAGSSPGAIISAASPAKASAPDEPVPAAEDFEVEAMADEDVPDADPALLQAELAAVAEREAQSERAQRVDDSVRIYQRQRDVEKAKANGTYVPAPSPPSDSGIGPVSTWAAGAAAPPPVPQIEDVDRPLYWSETMDLHLASMVRKHVFDFDLVAAEFQAIAKAGTLGLTLMKISEKLTSDSCRLRWTQLDARQWAAVDSGSGQAVPVYKVHVQVDALGKGHGAQPSFQAMSSLASSVSSYLTPPTQFPAVSDAASDDEDDGSKQVLDGLD